MQSGASASKHGNAVLPFFSDGFLAEWPRQRGFRFSRFRIGEYSFLGGASGFFRVSEGKHFRSRLFQTGGKALRTGCREGTDLHAVHLLR